MRIVFLSNYFNHHQAPISQLLNDFTNVVYDFIACEIVDAERASMGWLTDGFPSYVHQLSEEKEYCENAIDLADVVIIGSAPFSLIKKRLNDQKMTFLYSERWDKVSNPGLLKFIKDIISINLHYGSRKNVYCLCASAFTAYDLSKRFFLRNRCYKWGYFPEVKKYQSIEELIRQKSTNPVSILFVSRFIDWKHPELVIQVSKRLKEENVCFHTTMIGIGNMETQIHSQIEEYGLSDYVTHIRSMTPMEVRSYMERSAIFVFPSDRNEGWGAVLNESMNSGCAVVASSEIGSVPYLLKNNQNGFIFQDGNFDDLYTKIKTLCIDKDLREKFGLQAYNTMICKWNAEYATKNLIGLIDDLYQNGHSERNEDGPCGKAYVLKDGWFR